MFTCQRISDIEYYLAEADKAAETGTRGERDSAAYYLDNGTGEDKGTWWNPSSQGPGALVQRGGEVSPKAFRAMARGLDPRTGEPLIQQTKKERTAGYDCQFAAPKSVSVLWATATPETRAAIEQAHRAAVHRALDFAQSEGLIITRRGKGGKDKEPVADAAVAEFMHTTSRAGDPQLHSHAVLLNVAVRADGTTGGLDNARILQYQGAMGAMYRAELAASLERELGLAISRDARNFKVDGVPDEVTELFSKRRNAIESAAEIDGYNTASDRARAQVASLATRDKKADVPEREELEKRWTREIRSAGWTPKDVWASAKTARSSRDATREETGADPDETRASAMRAAGEGAIPTLENHDAVIERRHLIREVTERMQGVGSADDAANEVARLEASGVLIKIGKTEEDEPVYATPAMIATERSLIRGVVARKDEREFVSSARIEAAIAKRGTMSTEQADAVRHALNRDGVSVVEGSAGTGKSFSLGGVAEAARDAGLRVYVVAPSHKAKDVIRQDTATDEDSAKAVQGFLNRVSDPQHKDAITLSRGDCIIVDEAGMVGTRDMEALLRHAQGAGAKVILSGDTRQLQPVSPGGPMAVIAKVIGTQRIAEIRRQSVDWQRAASQDFATGSPDRALEAYDRSGRLHLVEGREASLAALAKDWKADVERNPEAGMAKPWEARLVVAGRNQDVHALNGVLRGSYREAGRLGGEDVEVQAFTRGQKGQLENLQLAAGDRLIFGESVTVGTSTISNSDTGTLESITPGADPVVRVRLDKGDVVEARWSEFVGFREKDAPAADRHPKVQHAYAVTTHAAQGTTVNRCYAYNAHGMGMESVYVAMTRHREDAAMYVDTSRIADRLEARQRVNTLSVSNKGQVDARDAEDIEGATPGDIERSDILKAVLHEAKRSEIKLNVSDFVGSDRAKWALRDAKPKAAPQPPSPIPPLDGQRKADLEASLAALDAMVAEGAAAPRPSRKEAKMETTPASPPAPQQQPEKGPAPEADQLRQRMDDRRQGPAYPPPPARQLIAKGIRGTSPDQELELFTTEIDLVRFLESRGYAVKEKWPNGWKMQHGSGQDTIHVKHGGTGHTAGKWVWTRPDKSETGSIIGYLQKVERVGSLGEVRKQLRGYLGESLDSRKLGAMPAAPVRQPVAVPERVYDLARIRQMWGVMRQGANDWLTQARGLRREVLDRFRADIRTEGVGSKQNAGGACFAHRNEAGEVVGYQRKGPRQQPTDKRGFSQWSSGGQKGITRMGDRENPTTIYVGETAIDLLSVYQLDGQPPRALLCALDGAASREAVDEVAKLAVKHPEARFRVAFDNDPPKERTNPHTGEIVIVPPAGDRMADEVTAAIRARAPEANVERHFPPADYKDWNDVVRGITRHQADARSAADAVVAPTTSTNEADERRKAEQRAAFAAVMARAAASTPASSGPRR